MTDFELGAVKAIPMPVHLMLDAASGALLAGAPWLRGACGAAGEATRLCQAVKRRSRKPSLGTQERSSARV